MLDVSGQVVMLCVLTGVSGQVVMLCVLTGVRCKWTGSNAVCADRC